MEALDLNDEPDLVVIQVYITSARRAYLLADHYRARGAYVVLGGLHVTSLPDEARSHADTIFIGPGEDTWPRFLADFGRAARNRIPVDRPTIAGIRRSAATEQSGQLYWSRTRSSSRAVKPSALLHRSVFEGDGVLHADSDAAMEEIMAARSILLPRRHHV